VEPDKINQAIIGSNTTISTPFGTKPLIYADYTASGRSLDFIENFIRQQVLPYYSNTHSETSMTGAQTNHFREQARETIRQCINASTNDKIIFCGSGATSAINKIIDIMQLRHHKSGATRPVVFIGPYEHHSNELPWRECDIDLVVIPETATGEIDLSALEAELRKFENRELKIGSFSAASNVTGLLTDVSAVASVLRKAGAFTFWDYAAAAPYVPIDASDKDAIFISPHKFPGGPGTPGVLVAKSHLFVNSTPVTVGGGTVLYVSPENHLYLEEPELREEGGTPAIVEAIRAGLVFDLQRKVGPSRIRDIELQHSEEIIERLGSIPNLELLGSLDNERLPIISFRIRAGSRYLHYGFVTALLNDLFGIQARGGCSCAGPYAHSLLKLDLDTSRDICRLVESGHGIYRPGWTRFSVNYFTPHEEIEYILSAIELIAEHGHKMLNQYKVSDSSGMWHVDGFRRQLTNLDPWNSQQLSDPDSFNFKQLLLEARAHLQIEKESTWCSSPATDTPRWFALESDLL